MITGQAFIYHAHWSSRKTIILFFSSFSSHLALFIFFSFHHAIYELISSFITPTILSRRHATVVIFTESSFRLRIYFPEADMLPMIFFADRCRHNIIYAEEADGCRRRQGRADTPKAADASWRCFTPVAARRRDMNTLHMLSHYCREGHRYSLMPHAAATPFSSAAYWARH